MMYAVSARMRPTRIPANWYKPVPQSHALPAAVAATTIVARDHANCGRARNRVNSTFSPNRVVMVLSSIEAIVSAIERGNGLGWVWSLALQHRDGWRVVAVRLEEMALVRPLFLVHPAVVKLPPGWGRCLRVGTTCSTALGDGCASARERVARTPNPNARRLHAIGLGLEQFCG
jgi:hypothetical protein